MTGKWFGIQHKGTKRTMGLMYIIISLLLNDEVHSAFEIIDSPSPFFWETALRHCAKSRSNLTVAIPAVNLTRMRVIDEIALKGEAWVGYFQSYKHFLFIVCVPQSVIESYINAKFSIGRTDNRPGMCYSLCGLQGYIGLQDGFCYCIAKRNFSAGETHPFNSSCQYPLHCGNRMLCGDQESSSISVYKEGSDSGCLIVTKDKKYEMSVVNCGSEYRHLCEAQTGQILYLAETPEKQQWVYSIKNCAKAGKRPTTFIEDITNFIFPNVSRPLWTSVVRDLVIRNCSDTCTTIGSHSYEGFLKNTDGVIQLEFVHAGHNSRIKSVVCMSGEKMEYSTSEKKDTSPEMISSDPDKTMSTRTTSKATSTSFASDQPSNEQGNSTKEPAETTITSVASEARVTSLISATTVILPVLALIAVVVALIIMCRKRRKEKATIHVEAPKETTTGAVVPCNAESHQTYYKHEKETLNQLEENDHGHVSSEYDTLKENNATFSAGTGNLYDTANFNIADGTYAVTLSVNNLKQAVQANSYDHVRLKKTNDGKYDHVDLQDQRNKMHDIDTYDQANALAVDNAYYDTVQKNLKLHQQFEENVYDAANFRKTN